MRESPIPHEERESIVKHRHERNVQIWLPVFLAAGLVVLLMVSVFIAYFSENPQVAKWAATASVILISLVLALMILLFIVLVGFIAGTTIGLKQLPEYSEAFSEQFLRYSALSRQYMDKAVAPIIAIGTWVKVPGDLFRRNRKDS